MIWWQIAFFVASTLITAALTPSPQQGQDAVAKGLDDASIPTAEEGRAIPVVFGDVLIKSPNVVWYGDLKTEAIRKKAGGGGGLFGGLF